MVVTNFNVGLRIQGSGMYTPEEENDSVTCARCYMDLIKQGNLTANFGSVPMCFMNLQHSRESPAIRISIKISIIFSLSFAGSVVVDFGCGSGALSLPLACLFLDLTFVCVDYKHESIRLLDQRTQAANLTNVSTWQVSKAMHFVLVIKCQH